MAITSWRKGFIPVSRVFYNKNFGYKYFWPSEMIIMVLYVSGGWKAMVIHGAPTYIARFVYQTNYRIRTFGTFKISSTSIYQLYIPH